jgi:hypothetical protein
LFFDAKVDAGYAHIKGERYIYLKTGTGSSESYYLRVADNSHAAALLSGGFSTGGIFTYGALTFMPQLSLDAMVLREEGFTEHNPDGIVKDSNGVVGDGFNLKVEPYFAKSARVFLGASVRYDIDLWGIYLQPEARAGYRYDFLSDATTLKAAFKDIDASTSGNQTGTPFSMTGPDPARGNFVIGSSLGATTKDWSLNFHFDFVRGDNGAFEEVGTVNLIGRI